jgi:hypothetical protein
MIPVPHRVNLLLVGLLILGEFASGDTASGPIPAAQPPAPKIEAALRIARTYMTAHPAIQMDRILQLEWQRASPDTAGAAPGRWRVDLVRLEGTPKATTDQPNVLWIAPDGTLTAERLRRSFDP